MVGLGLTALLAAAPIAAAAPGDLDPSFGFGGKVTTDFGGSYGGATAVAVQPDGKVVVVGETGDVYEDRSIAIARYNPDGSLDSTFSDDGVQTTDVSGGFGSGGRDLAIQADGKIVVVGVGGGVGTEQAVVVRYAADGSLDPTFSDDGQATLDFYSGSAVAIQPDGKIVVGGGQPTYPDSWFGFARLTESGELDPTFSGDGTQTISITGAWESVAALELDNAGRIVAGGRTDTDWGLLRLSSDGELDPTFSGDGKQTTDFGGVYENGGDNLTDLVVRPNGDVVAGGWRTGATLLARYDVEGTLDPGFTQTITGSEHPSNAVALQASGKIVTAGGSVDGFVAARYGVDGLPDSGFLGDGLGTVDFAGYRASDVAIQADGSIVLVGGDKDDDFGSDAEFGLVRLDGSDSPPVTAPPTNPTPPLPAAPLATPKPTKPAVARLTNVRLSKRTVTNRQRATIRFRLSAPARVSIKVFKFKAGLRKGKRCVKPSKTSRGKRCDLQAVSLSRSLETGAHQLTLPKLKAGQYHAFVALGTGNVTQNSPGLGLRVRS